MVDSDEEDLTDAELAAEIARLQQEVGEVDDVGDDPSDAGDSPTGGVPPHAAAPLRQGYGAKRGLGNRGGGLEEQLRQRDAEVAQLRALVNAGKGPVEALKEQKYLEALKKVRHLTVQLDKEKAATKKLTQQLVGLERQLLEAQNFNVLPSASPDAANALPGSVEDLQRQLRDCKVRLDKATKVGEQLRRQAQDSAAETRRVRQALAREVGEAGVDQALEEGTGWRGRAQLIALLRAKVRQLQRTAASSGAVDVRQPAGDDDASERTGITAVTAPSRRDHNDVHQERLERMQANRAKELVDLQLTLAARDKELREWKEKAEALQARVGTLDKYGQDLKLKLHRVITKTENDDKLLECYRQELAQVRGARKGAATTPPIRPSPRTAVGDGVDEGLQDLRAELAATKQRLTDLLFAQTAPRGSEVADGAAPARLRFAEVEVDKLRDLVQLLRDQLAKEIEQHAATAAHLRTERQRTAGLERALGKEGGPAPKITADDRTAMLREENRSLKEQLLVVHQTHTQEVAAYQDLIDQMRGSGLAEPVREGAIPSNPGARSAEEELQALQRQYSELRGMYNALAMKQTR
eukprot:GGOE01043971.1.p1 GENE.GGOE01043971.1~~GGOE01043971.1.p1  ORF type:complete len:582 (-),score=195.77 GGOE01043971.1:205-1950(-)